MGSTMHLWHGVAGEGDVLVWPDGCRDLIVVVPPLEAPALVRTGLDLRAQRIAVVPGTAFVGLRCAPGMRWAWDGRVAGASVAQRLLVGATSPPGLRASLARLRRSPEDGATLLAEAVERWGRPPDPSIASLLAESLEGASARGATPAAAARTLRRRLREATGAPPTFWRTLHRARAAARLLAQHRRPPGDVALCTGFADQAHLTRAMRRWFDTTPAALQRGRTSAAALLRGPDAFTLLGVPSPSPWARDRAG